MAPHFTFPSSILTRQTINRWLLLLVLLRLQPACMAALEPMQQQEALVAKQWQGRAIALRTSCYIGPFYEENEYFLLHPSPFTSLNLLADHHGNPIVPKHGSNGIVPAGTIFTVEALQFPTTWRLAQRLLLTPRHYPWLHLRAAKPLAITNVQDRAALPSKEQGYVWVLPLTSPMLATTALQHLATFWAEPAEISQWLEQRKPTVRAAIAHKQVLLGMSEQERFAAQGPPIHWLQDIMGEQPVQVAWFPHEEIWLEADVVVAIHHGRPLPTAYPTDEVIDSKPAERAPSGD